jgi:diguanylate cyclase (GGDEF)-like protein
LTGIYNRPGFEAAAMSALNGKSRDSVLLYIDLDGLKWINDHYGHDAGDLAITKTAELRRRVLRPSDIVARLGGDEFVAFLTNAGGLQVEDILCRLRKGVETENENWGVNSMCPSVSG